MAEASNFLQSRPEEEVEEEEEEQVDYMALIPVDNIVPFNYRFPLEPLLKPKLEEWRETKKPLGFYEAATIKIVITHASSPDDFVFTEKRHDQMRRELLTKMKAVYTPHDTDEYLIPRDLVTEKMPVVLVTSGEMFTRGYVVKNINKDTCLFQPLDGNAPMRVDKRYLRFVHRAIASFPQFAYRGKLTGVLPKQRRTWSEDAKRAFVELAEVNMRFVVGIITHFTTDGVAAMHLCRKGKKGEDIWIGDELVNRLMACDDKRNPLQLPDRALPEHNEQAAYLMACLGACQSGYNCDGSQTTSKSGGESSGVTGKTSTSTVSGNQSVVGTIYH